MNKRIQITVDPQTDLILSSIAKDLCFTKSELCAYIIYDQVYKYLEKDKILKYDVDK